MPTCRLCSCSYPGDQFIDGNGPRYLVCVRCAVSEGYLSEEDVPGLYGDDLAKARRYGLLFWLTTFWTLWLLLFQGIELWTTLTLVVLILATLIIPILFFLRTAKFNAQLRHLTP